MDNSKLSLMISRSQGSIFDYLDVKQILQYHVAFSMVQDVIDNRCLTLYLHILSFTFEG